MHKMAVVAQGNTRGWCLRLGTRVAQQTTNDNDDTT
jgi:hypothetical protein